MSVVLAKAKKASFSVVLSILLAGCSLPPSMFTKSTANANLVQGPPIEDVVTSFDKGLSCLRGRIPRNVIFAVGGVTDATGKESYADGSTGKFVSQGASEMVQSSLFRAGVSVVNRRDAGISIMEANWGIRDIKRQVPVNFYISGSINSLDFIPGGGFSGQIAGIGPSYRQSRILVALDLTMTDAYTGRVVANIPLQKQIFTKDAGGMEREAINFALRQMLSLATFEMLGQLMDQTEYAPCQALIEGGAGSVTSQGTGDREALDDAISAMNDSNDPAKELLVPVSNRQMPLVQGPQHGGGAGVAAPSATPGSVNGRKAVRAATLAIRAAKDSAEASSTEVAVQKAAESLKLSNVALLLLKQAAGEGFAGDEGDVAAVMVQQAMQTSKEAGSAAASRLSDQKKPQPSAPLTEGPGAPSGVNAQAVDPVLPATTPKETPKVPGSLEAERSQSGAE
jgi:curli biogenesis system outer membrane secretion channel CsgG